MAVWVRGSSRARVDHAPALWVRCRNGLPDASLDLGEGLGPGDRSLTWQSGEGRAGSAKAIPGGGGTHLFVPDSALRAFLLAVRRGGRLSVRAADALGVTRTVTFDLGDAATELDRLGCIPAGYWDASDPVDSASPGPNGRR